MQKISALPATEQLVLTVNLLYRAVMTVSDLIRTTSLFQVLRLSLRAGTIPHYSLPLSYWLWFLDTVYVTIKPCNLNGHLHFYRELHTPKKPPDDTDKTYFFLHCQYMGKIPGKCNHLSIPERISYIQ